MLEIGEPILSTLSLSVLKNAVADNDDLKPRNLTPLHLQPDVIVNCISPRENTAGEQHNRQKCNESVHNSI